MSNLTWEVDRAKQGQIVTEMRPQLSGAPDGEEGPAAGLRLLYDASNGDWDLYDGRRGTRRLARGNRFLGRPQPTVAEAMEIRERAREAAPADPAAPAVVTDDPDSWDTTCEFLFRVWISPEDGDSPQVETWYPGLEDMAPAGRSVAEWAQQVLTDGDIYELFPVGRDKYWQVVGSARLRGWYDSFGEYDEDLTILEYRADEVPDDVVTLTPLAYSWASQSPDDRPSINADPLAFAQQWYSADVIQRQIADSFARRDASAAAKIPPRVDSREFAVWLTDQYCSAMVKGAELAAEELRQSLRERDERYGG